MEDTEYVPPSDWDSLYQAISTLPALDERDAVAPDAAVEAAHRAWANTMALNNHGTPAERFYNMTGIIAALRDVLVVAKPLMPVAGADGPTRADLMSLIYQYALARLMANASVPTKGQRTVSAIVAGHERDEREVARLEAEITDALVRAGLK